MDHQQDSYIIPKIQFTLLKKDESSSSSSSSSFTTNNLSLLDPRIHVEFTLKDYIFVSDSSNNNNNNNNSGSIFSTIDPPLKLSTMALIIHENFCYKESIWMAMTCLGVEDRFINQVVEELDDKVEELFANFSDYVVNHPGVIVNEFSVHARVDIMRITGTFKVGDDANVCGFAGWDWASREWPVEWLV